jgi:hypothetical protein
MHQLRESCAGANMVCSRAERVFVLEHYFASKSCAAVREAFSNAYPDKEVPNKRAVQLVTTFLDTGNVRVSSRRWWTSTVKLFCKFFLTKTTEKTRLSCYTDVIKAYKYCCSRS